MCNINRKVMHTKIYHSSVVALSKLRHEFLSYHLWEWGMLNQSLQESVSGQMVSGCLCIPAHGHSEGAHCRCPQCEVTARGFLMLCSVGQWCVHLYFESLNRHNHGTIFATNFINVDQPGQHLPRNLATATVALQGEKLQ